MDLVYEQVAADLERRIRAGEWPHGGRLPQRGELAAEYGAAVTTIRRAQEVLEGRGLLRVVHGKGTFVTLGGGTAGAHDDDRGR